MRLTFNDRTDFEVDVLHLAINGLHLVINAASDREGLGCCHASLLLRQIVQPLKGLFDIFPPNQLLKELLCTDVNF
jgi:hypothetical protein